MRAFVWVAGLAIVVAAGAAVFIHGQGFTARARPPVWEETVAHAVRRWATPPAVRNQANPAAATPDVVRAAMEHWADHCAGCHANDGSGKTSIGKSFYPPAPDMRGPGVQEMSDGELFYVIERGIPLTGMPAWGNGTAQGERQSWELVLFIRHLPSVTEDEIAEMEKLNPRSAAQIEEERRIDDFLNGGR